MLTRKQLWRRQTKSIKRTEYDFLYNQGVLDENSSGPPRSVSEPSVTLLDIANLGRLWSTTGDLEIKPSKKSVRFGGAVHVLLIPTRDEYRAASLGDLMWWECDDYDTFKSAAIAELRDIMKLDPKIDSKMAQLLLYQPQNTPGLKEAKEVISGSKPELIPKIVEETINQPNSINEKSPENEEFIQKAHRHSKGILLGKTDVDILSKNNIKNSYKAHEDPLIYVSPLKEKTLKSSLKSDNKSYKQQPIISSNIRKETVHPLVYMCA